MKLSDFKGLFKSSIATFVSVQNPHSDYYLVSLKPAEGTTWEAGEHGLFTLPDNPVQGKKMRPFSVASVASENNILLGFRTGENISAFKQELINMKPGDRVAMRGPFGWFKLPAANTPVVMIASGVGITPIRALLKSIKAGAAQEVHVVYASSDFYLFGEELQSIADKNNNITLHKTQDRKQTQTLYEDLAKKFGNDAFYLISGAPAMIKGTKANLIAAGVAKKRMINDEFVGY